jgi:hypothetical protein
MNAMVHVLSCLVAYAFRPGKPTISLSGKHIEPELRIRIEGIPKGSRI